MVIVKRMYFLLVVAMFFNFALSQDPTDGCELAEYEIFVTGSLFKEAIKQLKTSNVKHFNGLEDFPKETLVKKLDAGQNLYFKGSRSSKMEQYLNLIIDD